jgi:hypothetical protein
MIRHEGVGLEFLTPIRFHVVGNLTIPKIGIWSCKKASQEEQQQRAQTMYVVSPCDAGKKKH